MLEDLNLTQPPPDDGPWRIVWFQGHPYALSEQSGTWEAKNGALVRVDEAALLAGAGQ